MRTSRIIPLFLILVLGGCAAGSWDPLAEVPAPMALPDGMDTRSAYAFYNYGQQVLDRSPSEAARAYYWASRLDPAWAAPLYARRLAVLMTRPHMFRAYLDGSRSVIRSPGIVKLDSLYLRALVLNPFLSRRQDATAFRYLLAKEISRDPSVRASEADIHFAIDGWLRRAGIGMRAWIAESEGRLLDAARLYEQVAEEDAPGLLANLSRVYFRLGRYEDARARMSQALAALRARDEDDDELVRLYNSKALLEYSLGMIMEQLDQPEEARQAYARALQEDLGYHPAHMRLGEMALAEGDTLTALSEMALAADIGADDASVLVRYGRVLADAGKHEDAAEQYRRAIEAEPYFAQPRFELARCLDALDHTDQAAEAYRAFLDKAARDHPELATAERRLREIGAPVSSGNGS